MRHAALVSLLALLLLSSSGRALELPVVVHLADNTLERDATPLHFRDLVVASAASTGGMHALNASTGVEVWNLSLPGAGLGPVACGAFICQVAADPQGDMFVVDQNGTIRWSRALGDAAEGWPDAHGDMVAVETNRTLFVFNLTDGSELWHYPIGGNLWEGPRFAGDHLLVTSNDGCLRWFALNGTLERTLTLGRYMRAPLLVGDTILVSVSVTHPDGGWLLALTLNGTIRWNSTLGPGLPTNPHYEGTTGRLYVGEDGHVLAVDSETGRILWSTDVSDVGDAYGTPIPIPAGVFVPISGLHSLLLESDTGRRVADVRDFGEISGTVVPYGDRVAFVAPGRIGGLEGGQYLYIQPISFLNGAPVDSAVASLVPGSLFEWVIVGGFLVAIGVVGARLFRPRVRERP